jgi:hypothetical protein
VAIISFGDTRKNVCAIGRGIRDKILAAHSRLMTAISESDGFCRCASGSGRGIGDDEVPPGLKLPILAASGPESAVLGACSFGRAERGAEGGAGWEFGIGFGRAFIGNNMLLTLKRSAGKNVGVKT